jgi:hypothetical protein
MKRSLRRRGRVVAAMAVVASLALGVLSGAGADPAEAASDDAAGRRMGGEVGRPRDKLDSVGLGRAMAVDEGRNLGFVANRTGGAS